MISWIRGRALGCRPGHKGKGEDMYVGRSDSGSSLNGAAPFISYLFPLSLVAIAGLKIRER